MSCSSSWRARTRLGRRPRGGTSRSSGQRPPFNPSDLQARLFEVEVALDAVHHLVAYAALVAELDQGPALRPEQLPHKALVGGGAFLDPVHVAEDAGFEAAAAVVVEAAHPLGRVLAHPVLPGQLLDAREQIGRASGRG